MYTCCFVARDRKGFPVFEELVGQYPSGPEAVYAFMEMMCEERRCRSAGVVFDDDGEIVATVTEIRRAEAEDDALQPGFPVVVIEVVVAGSLYPDGERWETKWVGGKFEKRRLSVSVAVSA